MPFYEYQCQCCQHKLEVLQKVSDEPLAYCPKCNEESLKKLISAAGFRLKGSGWYETDFKNKNSKKEETKSNPSPEQGSGSTGDKASSTEKSANSPQDNPSSTQSSSTPSASNTSSAV